MIPVRRSSSSDMLTLPVIVCACVPPLTPRTPTLLHTTNIANSNVIFKTNVQDVVRSTCSVQVWTPRWANKSLSADNPARSAPTLSQPHDQFVFDQQDNHSTFPCPHKVCVDRGWCVVDVKRKIGNTAVGIDCCADPTTPQQTEHDVVVGPEQCFPCTRLAVANCLNPVSL